MATFTKLNGFVEHLSEGTHNLGANTLELALSNIAPGAETPNPALLTPDCILANVTQIAYTNLSSRVLTVASSVQTSGIYKLTINDITLTSTGGSTGPFRYVYIFNQSATTPADALIGYYDYGSSITLLTGESLTVNFDDANGVLTLT
jgi:hypothetical protein